MLRREIKGNTVATTLNGAILAGANVAGTTISGTIELA